MSRVVKGGSRHFKPVNRTAASQQQQQLPTPPATAGTDGPLISAAEKMKLKARAAKAERAAEKLRNPSAAGTRRSTSVLTDTTSLGTKQPQQEDINVLQSHQQKAWSPPIDPLLDIAAFVDGVLQPTQDLDIPVPTNTNTNPPPPATTTTAKSQLPIKKKKHRAMVICDQSDKPIDNQQENEEEEEDISPRLKRKRHLEQLRKNKKNKAQPITTASINPEEEHGDISIEIINAKVNARAIKRRSNKQNGTSKKKQKSTTTEETIDEEEDEEDEALDPSKVSMASLTNPNQSKGQSSEILDKRLQLIIERRDRKKQERSLARLESKRKAKLVLINRFKDVKARQLKFQEFRGSEVGDNGSVVDKTDKNDEDVGQQGEDDEERDIDWAGDDNSTSIKENHKQKIIDEYGLDELNSDEDFEDFEEVEYDQFASSKNKKKTTQPQQPKESSTPKQTATGDNNDDEEEEEGEEEVVEEDFNVDDYVPQASLYAPQLRVVNGQMILDQDSLEVDRRDQEVELDEMEVVEESDATRLVNSNTWSKSIRGERWTVNDTGLFYDAVRLFGSDFEMISQLFPGRTRRQIRLKWNKEEKKSPEDITRALLGKKPIIRETSPPEEELETISEDPLEDQPPNQSQSQGEGEGEGEGQEKDEEEEIEKLVIPSHLTNFDQYARIVGIDCTGPIPVDPMDKWREKERLEFKELQASTDKLKKSDEQGSGLIDLVDNDDEEDDDLVIEENFGGWGELDG
ncbi:hypothetical protein Pst134EA_007164 [Puccinia striiformis f. sp. tritici]|uniref:hypothetical protein n=1 Tax=Puccinia striiformis f. sp. tritici TaxID=168172 RepID=UPI002008D898|nr:hypothetical protein Pst134EA_007164 [Puccinia striiformis f. sp. tritici]KAH9469892.1 hypothetical protein Pst134EA_007164 [Puccinia striiformis f. sp. tritici]